MPEEPRRSGRATKGQHTKKLETPEATESKKSKAKSKASKNSTVESATDGDDDADALIRCICGHQEDDGGRTMICCDNCDAWQHNDCMGLDEDPDSQPDSYRCEQCAPENHEALLMAIKRGEKPWEEAARRREEAEKQSKPRKGGKKGKRGRQSKSHEPPTISEKSDSPEQGRRGNSTISQQGGAIKRKHTADETLHPNLQTRTRTSSATAEKMEESATKRRKSSAPQSSPSSTSEIVNTISQLPTSSRKNVAEELKKRFVDQIIAISKSGSYRIPDGHTPDSLGTKFGILVEYSLFYNHPDSTVDLTESYKAQFRAICFNIKKNEILMRRLLTGKLLPDELATMPSDDMATNELKQQRAAMKEEADKQHVMIKEEEGPRIRRTHKGEEIVGGDDMITIEPVLPPAPPRRRESGLNNVDGTSHSPVQEALISPTQKSDLPPRNAKTLAIDTTGPPGGTERKSSSNFDIQNVWSSVQSPGATDQYRQNQTPRRQSFGMQQYKQPPLVSQRDDDIDRLLDDEDPDSAPYSPAEYSDPSTIWQGHVHMTSSGKFAARAQHVAGADLSKHPWQSIFPKVLEVEGRIEKSRADGYLSSLSQSRSTDVSVLQLTLPDPQDASAMSQFNSMFDYFAQRKRYGVVSKVPNENVRDTYIIFVEAGMGPLPEFLSRLAFNIIEEPRPSRMLLVTFVLKYKSPISSAQATPRDTLAAASPSGRPNSAMSPIASVVPNKFQQPFQHSPHAGNGFPANSFTAAENVYATNHGLAMSILGPLIDAPVVQQVLSASKEPQSRQIFENLKSILDDNPAARNNMVVFQQILSGRAI